MLIERRPVFDLSEQTLWAYSSPESSAASVMPFGVNGEARLRAERDFCFRVLAGRDPERQAVLGCDPAVTAGPSLTGSRDG